MQRDQGNSPMRASHIITPYKTLMSLTQPRFAFAVKRSSHLSRGGQQTRAGILNYCISYSNHRCGICISPTPIMRLYISRSLRAAQIPRLEYQSNTSLIAPALVQLYMARPCAGIQAAADSWLACTSLLIKTRWRLRQISRN